MDVKIAFLNGVIEEEVYIEQPEGFETFDRESHVCKLKWALYGLKQAPHAWYTTIDNYLTSLGLIQKSSECTGASLNEPLTYCVRLWHIKQYP